MADYTCRWASCAGTFDSSDALRDHVNRAHCVPCIPSPIPARPTSDYSSTVLGYEKTNWQGESTLPSSGNNSMPNVHRPRAHRSRREDTGESTARSLLMEPRYPPSIASHMAHALDGQDTRNHLRYDQRSESPITSCHGAFYPFSNPRCYSSNRPPPFTYTDSALCSSQCHDAYSHGNYDSYGGLPPPPGYFQAWLPDELPPPSHLGHASYPYYLPHQTTTALRGSPYEAHWAHSRGRYQGPICMPPPPLSNYDAVPVVANASSRAGKQRGATKPHLRRTRVKKAADSSIPSRHASPTDSPPFSPLSIASNGADSEAKVPEKKRRSSNSATHRRAGGRGREAVDACLRSTEDASELALTPDMTPPTHAAAGEQSAEDLAEFCCSLNLSAMRNLPHLVL
eukprot:Opistho-2@47337